MWVFFQILVSLFVFFFFRQLPLRLFWLSLSLPCFPFPSLPFSFSFPSTSSSPSFPSLPPLPSPSLPFLFPSSLSLFQWFLCKLRKLSLFLKCHRKYVQFVFWHCQCCFLPPEFYICMQLSFFLLLLLLFFFYFKGVEMTFPMWSLRRLTLDLKYPISNAFGWVGK